ncbi:MAG: hypothetical protein JSV92_04310 [archaeon]|nr:MAG: hypothetical protein JSV92_04310 [archaeon]
MELLYDVIALAVVLAIGYIAEEKMPYYFLLALVLVPAGLLMGYFLQPVFIYGILFILGLCVERMYFTYKWQMSRRPKSADYKRGHDWAMKLIATLIIIISIDMVSEVSLFYTFITFFTGVVVSWASKFFLERKR